jgi:hypothetical protein
LRLEISPMLLARRLLPVLTPWLRVTIPADAQPAPCRFARRLVYSTTAIISISTIASG